MDVELSDVLATFLDDWSPDNDNIDGITDCESKEDNYSKEINELSLQNTIKHRRNKVEKLRKLVSKKTRSSKPRMISSDIRESYPAMFANTFNSCELSLISGMCKRFYMPDVQVTVKKQVDAANMFISTGVGPMFIANILYCCSTWCPDAFTTLKNTSFYPDKGIVSFNFNFSTTKVYNIPTIHNALPSLRVENGASNSNGELSEEAIVQSLEKVKASMPLRKKPVKVVFRCTIKMLTNEHKRVQEFKLTTFVVENDFSVEV